MSGKFPGISGNFPGNFPEISTGMWRVPRYKNGIVTRQLKIFGHDLHEINSMIILDSSVEYLRNDK